MKIKILAICLLTASLTFAAEQNPKQGKLAQLLQKLSAIGKKDKAVAVPAGQPRDVIDVYQEKEVPRAPFHFPRMEERRRKSDVVLRHVEIPFKNRREIGVMDDLYRAEDITSQNCYDGQEVVIAGDSGVRRYHAEDVTSKNRDDGQEVVIAGDTGRRKHHAEAITSKNCDDGKEV